MNKKKFFKEKIQQVTCSIWELEFKVSKSRQVREGIRQDRDRSMEAVLNIENQLKTVGKDKNLQEKLENDLKANKENAERFEKQMSMIDKQIEGFTGNENEEPVIGILEQLKSYAELREMYKEHIKAI